MLQNNSKQEEINFRLQKEIIDIKKRLYIELTKEKRRLDNLKFLRYYVEHNRLHNFKDFDSVEFKEKMYLYNLMLAEYVGIGNLIDALISALNFNGVSKDEYYAVNPIMLALIMRTILEESSQMRFIFYKKPIGNKACFTFNKERLHSVPTAIVSMQKKNNLLLKVDKNPLEYYAKTDPWLAELPGVRDLISQNLSKKYLKLYSMLCNYSHNSKMWIWLDDSRDLLLASEKSILPLIREFNDIYKSYFEDELNIAFSKYE